MTASVWMEMWIKMEIYGKARMLESLALITFLGKVRDRSSTLLKDELFDQYFSRTLRTF